MLACATTERITILVIKGGISPWPVGRDVDHNWARI